MAYGFCCADVSGEQAQFKSIDRCELHSPRPRQQAATVELECEVKLFAALYKGLSVESRTSLVNILIRIIADVTVTYCRETPSTSP
jgi:hypothetical protein